MILLKLTTDYDLMIVEPNISNCLVAEFDNPFFDSQLAKFSIDYSEIIEKMNFYGGS